MAEALDLFAGPGGWDLAARELGIEPLGVELDDAACATREAAGLRTLQADVSRLDPRRFAPCWGLIASPPCQAFSLAGKGAGRRAMDAYQEVIATWGQQRVEAWQDFVDRRCEDPRAHLVLEPLRWALELRPRWVVCEQVEPVLPLWEATAVALREAGYRTWTGVLSAEQYGVPQTRRRAFLIALLGRQPVRPAPTHARYIPPRRKDLQEESLFAAPEPERIVLPEDRELQPWVSMAQALGWGMNARPHLTVRTAHGTNDVLGGSGARESMYRERDEGRWDPYDQVGFPRRADTPSNHATGRTTINGVDYRERDFRSASEPALALTEKARSTIRLRANAQKNAAVRDEEEPAPTITGGHDHNERVWVTDTGNTRGGTRESGRDRVVDEPAPVVTSRADQLERRSEPTHMNTGRDWKPGGDRGDAQRIPVEQPAPAVTAKLGGQAQWQREREVEPRDSDWPSKRPATMVAGDPRLAQPGHKNEESRPDCPGRMEGAVRVTEQEAAVLQSFPADHPWQGTRTARFRQIGDAVPPPLARAVLTEATRHEERA